MKAKRHEYNFPSLFLSLQSIVTLNSHATALDFTFILTPYHSIGRPGTGLL